MHGIANHFVRHKRTHEQQQNGEPIVDFSEEDFENDEHNIGELDQESPESEHAYLSGPMSIPTSLSDLHTHSPLGHTHSPMGHTHSPMGSMSTGTNHMNGPSMNGTSMGPPQMVSAHNY